MTQDAVKIRVSTLENLFDCPARWASQHLDGRTLPQTGNARLGTAIHAGTAAFDRARMEGNPISIDDAAGVVVDTIWNKDEPVEWYDDKPEVVENVAVSLHTLYCREIAPKYIPVAVEVECEALQFTDLGLILTGTTDRVYKGLTTENMGILDIKSGKNIVSPDGTVNVNSKPLQLGGYELMTQVALGVELKMPAVVVGLQAGKTSKGQRVGTGYLTRPRDLLVGTKDHPGALEHASRIIHGGWFPGNPRSMMCSEKYCPIFHECKFHG